MLKRIWIRIYNLLKNKFLLTTALFLAWLIFFDANNIITRVRMINDVRKLKKDCSYYKKRIVEDSIKLHQLKSSPDMLEKFAREQYLMKKDDEEIFVIVEE